MTYGKLYEYGVKQLNQAEVTETELNARLLLESICGTGRNDLLVHADREVAAEQEEKYREYIAIRAKHVPLQYITGEQEFMGLTFKVSENVLIPRQDTECLVEEVMRDLHDGMRILDMCTGSGCILLSLLHYSNDCTGVGADISEKALETAAENAVCLGITEDTVRFVQSNLFERITGKFDRIISNPPYIPSDVIPTLMEEVKTYEPMGALDGGIDGLTFYRRIVEEGRKHLCRGGKLYFEIGYDQAEDVSRLLQEAGFTEVETVKDLAGLDRVVYGSYLED